MTDTARHPSLLQYWSIRYFLTITLSVAITMASSLSILWVVLNHKQIRGLAAMARDVAAMAEDNDGTLPNSPRLHNTLEDMGSRHGLTGKPILFILDNKGTARQQHPPDPPIEAEQLSPMLPKVMTGSAHVLTFKSTANHVTYMVGVQPMLRDAAVTGYLLYFEKKQTKLRVLFYNSPRFILLFTFLLIGWAIVYTMTRRLVKPIREVAEAAKKVVAGTYEININKQYKEAEIYGLTHSFNEMTNRLARMEALRSQLLAGITKELNTPVVSINNRIQAVKNHEVSGEEASAYLEASLEESQRLQTMIENLLEFNRFIASEVSVTRRICDLDSLITEIIDNWKLNHNDSTLQIVKETANDGADWQTWTDPIRVEQILIHLLNNAKAAMSTEGMIRVLLKQESVGIRIEVQDTGRGIPREEYEHVFEPFYRGDDHKMHVRGLGIGLPFSRLIARSLGGQLVLSDGTRGKTTFALILPSDHKVS